MEFSIGMVTFVMNYGIVRYGYGEDGLAAYLIMGYLMLIILTLFLGMAEGLQPAFSYLEAAGERGKLYGLLRLGAIVFGGIGVVSYLIVLLFSVHFNRIFTPETEAIALFAAERSKVYFCGFICAGINILMISFFQATAATGRSLLISSLRGFILPAVFVLVIPFLLGAEALWGCHFLAEMVTLLVCIGIWGSRK